MAEASRSAANAGAASWLTHPVVLDGHVDAPQDMALAAAAWSATVPVLAWARTALLLAIPVAMTRLLRRAFAADAVGDLAGTQDAPSPRRGDARQLPICGNAENWLALAAGGALLVTGVHRRSAVVACVAVSSTPLLCCGVPAVHERDVLGHEFMGEVDPCSNLMDTHG